MTFEVLELINNCEWYASRFLIVSENVFSPLLYYSYFAAAIPVVIMGLFIYLNGRNRLENRLLFYLSISVALWVFCALVTWATEFPRYTMFFWSLLVILEPLIRFFSLYFIYVLFFKKDFSLRQKIIFALPLLPVIFLASSKLYLMGYDISNCDRAAPEGILSVYAYTIELVYTALILVYAFFAYRKSPEAGVRRKIFLVTTGVILFLVSFSLGNILETFTENWYIGQYGLFGVPVFMALLAYVIVRFNAFDIKLIATQALVVGLAILIGSQFFFIQNNVNRILTVITLVIAGSMGIAIVKSVKKEISLKDELEVANKNQQSLIHFISHQLKGFFTKSKMIFAGIVEEDFGQTSPILKEVATEGLKSDDNAVSMIQNILGASNLRKGTTTYQMNNVDFAVVVKKACDAYKMEIEAKGLEFITDIETGPITIKADEKQIAQVVRNLIDNSIKYTPKGFIKVILEKKIVNGKEKVLFNTEDSGVGLTESDKHKLFTEGGRGDDSVKVNVNSTGYGLYIVRKIVEAHNGKIWAESEGRGHGSKFFVEMDII